MGSTPAPASTVVEAQAAYAYSPNGGRIAQISNPQIPNQTFTYQYLPKSDLIEKVTGLIHTFINSREPTRNVLDTKTNKLAITVISKYDYAVNAIGQRTGVATSGTAYPALPSWLWGYDALGQVTSADSSVATSDRAYQYDAVGNRIEARDGATTANGVTTLYLYDGWNCIAEYTRSVGVSPTLQKTRLWGTDLSGSPQGAGGVGGMLSESSPITSNPITFNSSYPTYDGNGNVSEYLDSTGQVTAHYEYDPFGNTVVNTDTANQFA